MKHVIIGTAGHVDHGKTVLAAIYQPALDVLLEHASEQVEAGQPRRVALRLKAVAFGADAERLATQPLGATLWCAGFLTSARRGHGIVFHIQDFKPI